MAGDSERLEIDITAKDDASKVVDALAKKVDALEGETTTVEVDADTGDAESEVDSFAKRLDKLTTADQIILLAVKAGAAQSELAGLAADIGRLDASDPTIDVKLDQYAQTSAQLDDLEGKIKAIGDADPDAGAALDKARGRLQGMGEDAGKAQDAVHSMAGNAVGDFAATTSGIGPLGEAVGQLVEGIGAGEIGLKNLATAGLGLGGIAAGMVVVTKIMGEFERTAKRAAEVKAFRTEQVDAFTASIREGKDAVAEFVDKAEAAGKLEGVFRGITAGSLGEIGPQIKTDLIEPLTDAGVTVRQFAEVVTGSKADMDRFGQSLTDAGVPADQIQVIMSSARTAAEDYGTATEQARRFTEAFGTEQDETGRKMQGATGKAGVLSDALARMKGDEERAETAARKLKDELQRTEDRFAQMSGAIEDDQALLNLADQFDAVRDAAKEQMDAQIAANDATAKHAKDAVEKQDAAVDAARRHQEALNSLKLDVIAYAQQVGGIPESAVTDILTKIDNGSVNTAEAAITKLAREREVLIKFLAQSPSGWYLMGSTKSGQVGGPVPGMASAPTTNVTNNYLAAPASARQLAETTGRRSRINGRR